MDDTPFFIVGSARSGTTLLRMMLNAHPEVALPPESRFIVELY
ncbi:MAG: sulfotransferase, partial [Actinomycetota bacterium]